MKKKLLKVLKNGGVKGYSLATDEASNKYYCSFMAGGQYCNIVVVVHISWYLVTH